MSGYRLVINKTYTTEEQFVTDCSGSFRIKLVVKVPKTYSEIRLEGLSLVQTMKNMFLEEPSSDFKIICDSKEFPVHKLILSSRSDVFKTMLGSDTPYTEVKNGALMIEDISSATMKSFLKFMYTDMIKQEEINCELLYAANRYDFKRLASKCLIEISKSINEENAVEVLKAAYLLDKDELFRGALDKIKQSGSAEIKAKLNELMKAFPEMGSKISNLLLFN